MTTRRQRHPHRRSVGTYPRISDGTVLHIDEVGLWRGRTGAFGLLALRHQTGHGHGKGVASGYAIACLVATEEVFNMFRTMPPIR
jgi:hypothetical protein